MPAGGAQAYAAASELAQAWIHCASPSPTLIDPMALPDEASLTVILSASDHSTADLAFVSDALNGVVTAGVWGAIASPEIEAAPIRALRDELFGDLRRPEASSRFFPGLPRSVSGRIVDFGVSDFSEDPSDPLDAGVRDGLNSYLRRLAYRADPELYRQVFSFASVTRAEHHSPLLLELSIALGAVTLPAILVVSLLKATVAIRKSNAEASIRETELEIRREELNQKRLQTRILEHVEWSIAEMQPDQVPKEAIVAASQVSTTAITDLSSKSLIGSVTLGLSTKA